MALTLVVGVAVELVKIVAAALVQVETAALGCKFFLVSSTYPPKHALLVSTSLPNCS